MSAEEPQEISQVTYEQLAAIEDEFEDVDTQIIKQQYALSAPVFAKRAAVIREIPNFWAIVLETCPPEIDQFIQPQDSQIFAESLRFITVSRPEIDGGKSGNPRSVTIKMEFKPNDFFADTVLEKTFHWRRASDGWTGLVSEPVQVQWLGSEKDLSEGLNDMAVKLFQARKKAGDFLKTDLPEYKALAEKLQTANAINTSFFTWFGFVSGRRYVTAEESDKAEAEYRARKAKGEAGKPAAAAEEEDEEDEEDKNDDSIVEVHEEGEQLAIAIAEDLWPGAIKYFTQAQGMDEMSDIDFEEMDVEDLDDDEDEDGEGGAVDMRALVDGKAGKSSDGAPAAKKQKK